MRIDIITIFPDMFMGFLQEGMVRIAIEKKLLAVYTHDLRNWTTDSYKSVDDRPYGGGPGMVLKPDVAIPAVEEVARQASEPIYLLPCPQGSPLLHEDIRIFSNSSRLLILSGRYEGYDERIRDFFPWREFSIGDFVLSGGEVPAMAVVDAVARQIPGVLGHECSASCDSFAAGLLDHPHYTRPEVYRNMRVPEVLLSGNHALIDKWRLEKRIENTRSRRPDLFDIYESSEQIEKETKNETHQ